MNLIKSIFKYVLLALIASGISGLLYMGGYVLYDRNFSIAAMDEHYLKMYNQIGINSGQMFPPMLISDGAEINAYANQNNVIITRGMLAFVNNDDELALVMGHEIGHYILKHVFQELPSELNPIEGMFWGIQAEENADKIGAFLAMQSGYDVCTGREVWKRMHEKGDALENSGHPTSIFRYVNLHLPQCRGDL